MAFEEFTLESFIWENTMRAAPAVAPNLPPPPEERRPMRGIKPLERSKYHRRRLGTPPRRDADCGSQWRFPRFRVEVRRIGRGTDEIGVRCRGSDPFCPYAHTNPAEHLVRHCVRL